MVVALTSISPLVNIGFLLNSSCVVIISNMWDPRTDKRSLSRYLAWHASRRDLWVNTSNVICPESLGSSGKSSGGASGASYVTDRCRLRELGFVPNSEPVSTSMGDGSAMLNVRRRGVRTISLASSAELSISRGIYFCQRTLPGNCVVRAESCLVRWW